MADPAPSGQATPDSAQWAGAPRGAQPEHPTDDAVHAGERRFRALIEHSADVIGLLDAQGTIIYTGPSSLAALGYRPDEFVGRTVFELVHPDDRADVAATFELLVRQPGTVQHAEFRIRHRDGSWRWVESASTNLLADPDVQGIVINYHDVTARKLAEEERRRADRRLREAMVATILAVSRVVEKRDPYTAGHEQRVTDLAVMIAGELGLSRDRVEGLRLAAAVHDIGKVAVPAEILARPGKLSPLEFEFVKTHVEVGYEILKDVDFPWPVAEITRQHHERWDGSGYPRGLRGEEILLEARILAVADVVVAIASHRPYRPSLGLDRALDEIRQQRGVLYDPAVVEACLRLSGATYHQRE